MQSRSGLSLIRGRALSDVLYIHPPGHLNDLVVPAGAISCMNAVRDAKKLGRYAFEVKDEEIENAKVIAVDLHWGISTPAFLRLIRHVRARNPDARIVVGGITAGHLASELIEQRICDFVVKGDSEVAFKSLVSSCLEGKPTQGIPNIVQKGVLIPPLRRMTQAEFDSTDTLTTDWFPTFEHISNLETKAFTVGKFIIAARGCLFRCKTCYGSVAEVFGRGILVRSPQSLVTMLKIAQAKKIENLRLILGKLPQRVLSGLLKALYEAGPFDFATSVGLYLCTPLTDGVLFMLDRTFKNPVVISVVPPEEHEPALSDTRLKQEMEKWERICRKVSKSQWLRIDMWANERNNFERLKRDLSSDRVRVSLATVWQLPRPGTGMPVTLGFLEKTYDKLWTYFVARLVSPTLASLLAPFGFLDELEIDPFQALEGYKGVLGDIASHALSSFGKFMVPMFSDFSIGFFFLSSFREELKKTCGIRCSGDVRILRVSEESSKKLHPLNIKPLERRETHKDILWESPIRLEQGHRAVAFVPVFDFLRPTWVVDEGFLTKDGVVALKFSPSLGGKELALKICYRLHSLWIYAEDAKGNVVAKGKADLEYFVRRIHVSYERIGGDWTGLSKTE